MIDRSHWYGDGAPWYERYHVTFEEGALVIFSWVWFLLWFGIVLSIT